MTDLHRKPVQHEQFYKKTEIRQEGGIPSGANPQKLRELEQKSRIHEQSGQAANQRLEQIERKEGQLDSLEKQANKAAAKLDKQQEKDAKAISKDKKELNKQEAKMMEKARNLAEKQAKLNANEAPLAREMNEKEYEAQRLADELLANTIQDREIAENRVNDLTRSELEAKQQAQQLQGKLTRTEETMRQTINSLECNEKQAKMTFAEIQTEFERVQKELENAESQLREFCDRAQERDRVADGFARKRQDLLIEAERLSKQEGEARLEAVNFSKRHEQQFNQIEPLHNQLASLQQRQRDAKQSLGNAEQQKSVTVTKTQETIQADAAAKKAAENLAKRLENERKAAIKLFEDLVGKEQEAKKRAFSFQQTTPVQNQPTDGFVDIYQHTQIKATDPGTEHVQAATAHFNENEQPEDKSLFEKIKDKIF